MLKRKRNSLHKLLNERLSLFSGGLLFLSSLYTITLIFFHNLILIKEIFEKKRGRDDDGNNT